MIISAFALCTGRWFVQALKNDVLKDFFHFSGNYFSISLSDPHLASLQDDSCLNEFLDSGSCHLLGALLNPDEGKILLTNKVREELFVTYIKNVLIF